MSGKLDVVKKYSGANTRKFSFREEAQKYCYSLQQHYPVILSIGIFFGWLLSFPMQGPLMRVLAQSKSVGPVPLGSVFIAGIILGMVIAGIGGYFTRRSLKWFNLAAVGCFILSLAVTRTPSNLWMPLFAFLGIFSGLSIISWGYIFARTVPPDLRGRTFVTAAFLSNLILYVLTIITLKEILPWLMDLTSLLPLAMTAFLQLLYRQTARITFKPAAESATGLQTIPLRLWTFLPFIFTIYAVGGLMYSVTADLSSQPAGILAKFGLFPYLVFLLLAGSLTDIWGRRINAVLGAAAVGIGFMLVGMLHGSAQYIMMQIFMVGGYAFLDTFTWVIAADASHKDQSASLLYLATLGANLLAILIGLLLGNTIYQFVNDAEVLTVQLAGLLCFVSIIFIIRMEETLRLKTESSLNADLLPILPGEGDITPREMDIIQLLIEGASTQEILRELSIAPTTLKTHLRNIYHKTGVRNRWEFTAFYMRNSHHSNNEPPN